ncbi:transcriptional regulator [Caulobacter segnis]|uniref:winged helix-turn-helix domain-containing protein n=1 Tax=Caulobacter segnis TaxID=88688 RepID=UPI001CC04FE0|nr:transcriptional regulator [Caulobacter segnis]UAL12414.1 transcriptional regulator [Caulobacter segnis]
MLDARTFAFGAFLLIPQRQLLLREGVPVRIGSRALDLLRALVERPGELVAKRDLIARAWPATTVDESNLKVNIAALRRALDDDAGDARYIATVSGRGYRFIAPVEMTEPARAGPPVAADTTSREGEIFEAGGNAVAIDGAIMLRLEGVMVWVGPGSRSDLGAAELDGDRPAGRPRRVLLVELDGRDEAWLRAVLTRL